MEPDRPSTTITTRASHSEFARDARTDVQEGPANVPRHVVVIVTEQVASKDSDAVVRAHAGQDVEVQVHVCAPVSKLSWLRWLTNVESVADPERADDPAPVETESGPDVEVQEGELDPLQAVEDALRMYAADELIIITAPDEETSWIDAELESQVKERFGLPVTHLVATARTKSRQP
jgi:hypothetical protein